MIFEEIVYVLMEEMFSIDGFDEDIVNELCFCVKDCLLIKVIVIEEKFVDV